MSRPDLLRNIKDGQLRDLAKAALKQKFALESTRREHLRLVCPQCRTFVTFTKTSSNRRAFPAVLSRLRSHGFTYQGRSGKHTAVPPGPAKS